MKSLPIREEYQITAYPTLKLFRGLDNVKIYYHGPLREREEVSSEAQDVL
jgi:hypothetical protein